MLHTLALVILLGYHPLPPRAPAAGEIPVDRPGCLTGAGQTYLLTRDITDPLTPFYLGQGVTLDLNGHTVTYAAGYGNLPNHGFEDGLTGWDTSRAPGARVVPASVRPLVGDWICELPEGQELLSPYLELPVADRAYYAQVAVATRDMAVTINVDDEQGRPVDCKFRYGDNLRPACPEENRSPKLGGGVVFALVWGQPAGRYRIRVKATRGTCLIDEVDLRPALDVGVGIVDEVRPWAYYKCVLDGDSTAFFNIYQKTGELGIPLVKGPGTVTIRNGVLRSGSVGIRSWAIQSTARETLLRLENLRVEARGLNTNAVDAPRAEIRGCDFVLDTPFIIDRHDQTAVAVNLGQGTEISDNRFLGGQGCLNPGAGAVVHDNLFVNRQTVTNHYSVACGRQGNRLYNNRFEPAQGSGIYISGRAHEVHHNTFLIATAPPNCEYRYEDWSQNAIRMSDYDRDPGSEGSCFGNDVHHNIIRVTARAYPEYDRYLPAAYGIHYSCGGGVNLIHDNDIRVHCPDPRANVAAAALFISGAVKSGADWYRNRLEANVPVIWLGGRYGSTRYHRFWENTIVKGPEAPADFQPLKIGWWRYTTTDTEFYSNRFENCEFGVAVEGTGRASYSVGYTLTVAVVDGQRRPRAGIEVTVAPLGAAGVPRRVTTDADGRAVFRLPSYRVDGPTRIDCAGYRVTVAGRTRTIELTADETLLWEP